MSTIKFDESELRKIFSLKTVAALRDAINSIGAVNDGALSSQAIASFAAGMISEAADDAAVAVLSASSMAQSALAQIGAMGSFGSEYLVIVDAVDDLPPAVAGVITLQDNYTYLFTTVVDLAGDRIVCGQNTVIIGASSENCRIKSTGLVGTALITSEWSLPMRNITIEADIALDLDATGHADQALDWFGVNFTDCATVGTVANYGNFIVNDSAFLESDGLTLDGSFNTVAFAQTLFDSAAGGTMITIPATATINRRFRIIYASFVVGAGETGLNVSSSASIPTEGYILDTVNFSGAGTYTTGVAYSDNKALWINCRGVVNSAAIGFMTMQANATATTVSATSTYYKIAGTTTLESISQKFTHSSNRLTYVGEITRDFRVNVTATMTSGNNQELGVRIAKNGTTVSNTTSLNTTSGTGKAEGAACQGVIQLATNDYLEIFVSNETAIANITATYLSVIAEAVN
jgi:hypothetical protein